MSVINTVDAQAQLDAVCERVLAGEIIRLRNGAGALVELTPVRTGGDPVQSGGGSAAGDEDAEWAAFENRCGQASD